MGRRVLSLLPTWRRWDAVQNACTTREKDADRLTTLSNLRTDSPTIERQGRRFSRADRSRSVRNPGSIVRSGETAATRVADAGDRLPVLMSCQPHCPLGRFHDRRDQRCTSPRMATLTLRAYHLGWFSSRVYQLRSRKWMPSAGNFPSGSSEDFPALEAGTGILPQPFAAFQRYS